MSSSGTCEQGCNLRAAAWRRRQACKPAPLRPHDCFPVVPGIKALGHGTNSLRDSRRARTGAREQQAAARAPSTLAAASGEQEMADASYGRRVAARRRSRLTAAAAAAAARRLAHHPLACRLRNPWQQPTTS